MTIPVNDTLLNTLNWFKVGRPEPTEKDTQTQIGVHFEEVAEMIAEIDALNPEASMMLDRAHTALTQLADYLKKSDKVVEVTNRVEYLDALCDQIVTATGCAYLEDFRIVSALHEVNRSNWSKFIDGKPIYDENKKIIKGPDYIKADLKPFV